MYLKPNTLTQCIRAAMKHAERMRTLAYLGQEYRIRMR